MCLLLSTRLCDESTTSTVSERRFWTSPVQLQGQHAFLSRLTLQELAELAGYTSRVADILETMEDVKQGHYQKKLVSGGDAEDNRKCQTAHLRWII